MSDLEMSGTAAHSQYSTDALLPNDYVFLYGADFARGNKPSQGDTWALVTGCVRRAGDAGWNVFLLLPTGEKFVHGRQNPTVIRAVDGAVPHAFNPVNLTAQVVQEETRLEAAQNRLARLRALTYYAQALDTARMAADSRKQQPEEA